MQRREIPLMRNVSTRGDNFEAICPGNFGNVRKRKKSPFTRILAERTGGVLVRRSSSDYLSMFLRELRKAPSQRQ